MGLLEVIPVPVHWQSGKVLVQLQKKWKKGSLMSWDILSRYFSISKSSFWKSCNDQVFHNFQAIFSAQTVDRKDPVFIPVRWCIIVFQELFVKELHFNLYVSLHLLPSAYYCVPVSKIQLIFQLFWQNVCIRGPFNSSYHCDWDTIWTIFVLITFIDAFQIV